MFRKLLAAAGLAIASLLPLATAAQPQAPAFDLVVRAPDPLRELLERNLELRRYREVTDLDDAEIARLVVLAEKDARELLATQGYFAPQVRIGREPGPRTTLLVEVDPGPRTLVSEAAIEFEGDIATSPDADAATQREGIRSVHLPRMPSRCPAASASGLVAMSPSKSMAASETCVRGPGSTSTSRVVRGPGSRAMRTCGAK